MMYSGSANLAILACPGGEHFADAVIQHLRHIYIEKFNRNVKYFINNQKEYIEENVGEYNRYKKIFLSDITYNMSDFEDIIIIDKEDFEKTLSNLKNKNNYIEKLLDFRKVT